MEYCKPDGGKEVVRGIEPGSNFFGGVANILTRGSWSTREEMETYKLLAFAQSTYRALRDMGVTPPASPPLSAEAP